MPRACASLNPMLKYIHARLPGRELVHLIEPANLKLDARFAGHDQYIVGWARALCGRKGQGWIVDGRGEACRWCETRR